MLTPADTEEFRLLNDFQRNFPLVCRPFAQIGETLGQTETEIIASLWLLKEAGRISRVGPVFAPNRIGASTLAALSVPQDRLADVAARVSARPEVNHNYLREHAWNLWFVAAARDKSGLARVLNSISYDTGLPMLSLPLEQEYHIDLGFDLKHGRAGLTSPHTPGQQSKAGPTPSPQAATGLIAALQSGLPLVPRPYAAVGAATGMDETAVLDAIAELLSAGLIKRFGVVVRHHELGYRANAMCVWDVPDSLADELGARLAREDAVTLCYRRRRGHTERKAGWPYNLFCMIHGRERATVEAQHADICRRQDLHAFPSAMLFSTRRYKQCGARYAQDSVHG